MTVLPMFPVSRASARRGLFCFKRASWSGFARNISRINTGSSSIARFWETGLAVRAPLLPAPGTSIALKSRFGTKGKTNDGAFQTNTDFRVLTLFHVRV